MAIVLDDRADDVRWNPAVRRWSGIVLVGLVVGSAVSTGALAAAADPVRMGSAVATRQPSVPAVRMEVRPAPSRSAGTVTRLRGPVVASTGPAPTRAELREVRPGASRDVARSIAHHLAEGNTEVARYVIPYEVHRATGCRVGFISTTVDTSRRRAVKAERKARRSWLRRSRDAVGRAAVAHAAEPTAAGQELHVIVAQLCPVRRGT